YILACDSGGGGASVKGVVPQADSGAAHSLAACWQRTRLSASALLGAAAGPDGHRCPCFADRMRQPRQFTPRTRGGATARDRRETGHGRRACPPYSPNAGGGNAAGSYGRRGGRAAGVLVR